MNHLAGEKSPYLLQHVRNPVDWYPWGEEAFKKARREDKPIFLSIGYSTCHWCHVMERESFEDPNTAEVLNRGFVAVKVDREERPDVDKLYMTAALMAGWGGGWPLSLWLTPDLEPFVGGTYFPPESRQGIPGFRPLLIRIARLWKERRSDIAQDARRVAAALKAQAEAEREASAVSPAQLDKAFEALLPESRHDGGQGPKFPMPSDTGFLLLHHARTGCGEALEIARRKLGEMAAGGIYDHVGGGFHRYSVDGSWRVPHFEKMLYDNAQLAVNYVEAFQASGDPGLARVARETLDYVLRDMTHPEGGFYSAEDADSKIEGGGEEKAEGAFYVWSEREVVAALGQAAGAVFGRRYGVRPEGNAPHDPHGEFEGKNILYAARTLKETAEAFGKTEVEIARVLEVARGKLLEARAKRPRPHLDDKVLASWNGLMISAFAKGYQAFEEPAYLKAAEEAARFIRKALYEPGARKLWHRWREGERAVAGMADDYAFLAQGLVDLYEASFDPDWLDWALELADTLQRDFFDPERGGYYMTAKGRAPRLLARMKEDSDGVEPSAASVACLSLLRLAELTGREDYRKAAERTLAGYGGQLRAAPRSMMLMLAAAGRLASPPRQIIIAGAPDHPGTRALLRVVHSRRLPARTLIVLPSGKERERMARRLPVLKGMVPLKGEPAAYVCGDFACALPTSDPLELVRLLDGAAPRARESESRRLSEVNQGGR
ncbi:MAG: thioredoxin domain-containing protein [Elusimicrobiota bacterium]